MPAWRTFVEYQHDARGLPGRGSHRRLQPISFLFNGPDWVRYLPAGTPRRAIVTRVFRSSFVPSILLTIMGAYCATLGNMSDPVAGLKPFIPGWLFVIYIASVIGGSLANSVPTYYSSGLTLQALGLKVHRWTATALDVVVSTLITLYVIFVQDFTTALNDFIALLMMWVGPFGGVWVADAWLRRGKYDGLAIHGRGPFASRYWGWHGFNICGCMALSAGMLAAGLTMKSPLYDGPIARLVGGADELAAGLSGVGSRLRNVGPARARRNCGPVRRHAPATGVSRGRGHPGVSRRATSATSAASARAARSTSLLTQRGGRRRGIAAGSGLIQILGLPTDRKWRPRHATRRYPPRAPWRGTRSGARGPSSPTRDADAA